MGNIWIAVAIGGVVALTAASEARADPPPAPPAPKGPPAFSIGPSPTWILLGGLTTGGTVALADKGALVGGEVSLALLREGNHVGFYTDAYYDWGADGTYVTGGLELGHKFVGLDGGVATRWEHGDHEVGLAARLSVGIGMVSLYCRYMHFPHSIGDPRPMVDDNVLQVGLLLKLPLSTIPTGN